MTLVWAIAGAMLVAAAIVTMARLLAGPSTLDRLVATDTLVAVTMCGVGTWAAYSRDTTVTFQGKRVTLNGLGFRGPEPAATRPPKRIVCMGASPTFGWGVGDEDAYPAQLQRRLDPSAREVEVLNAAVIGYSSHQGRLLLERSVLPLQPDVVTVSYLANEPAAHRFFRIKWNIVFQNNAIDPIHIGRIFSFGER